MNHSEFERLELEVDRLLEAMERLQVENRDLRYQLARHTREKYQLFQNNRQIAGKIREIISNLQETLL